MSYSNPNERRPMTIAFSLADYPDFEDAVADALSDNEDPSDIVVAITDHYGVTEAAVWAEIEAWSLAGCEVAAERHAERSYFSGGGRF